MGPFGHCSRGGVGLTCVFGRSVFSVDCVRLGGYACVCCCLRVALCHGQLAPSLVLEGSQKFGALYPLTVFGLWTWVIQVSCNQKKIKKFTSQFSRVMGL